MSLYMEVPLPSGGSFLDDTEENGFIPPLLNPDTIFVDTGYPNPNGDIRFSDGEAL